MGTITGEPKQGLIYLHQSTTKDFRETLSKTQHKTADTFLNELIDLFLLQDEQSKPLQVNLDLAFRFFALLSGTKFANCNDLMKHLLVLHSKSLEKHVTNTQTIPNERSSNRKRKSQPRRNIKPIYEDVDGDLILESVADDTWKEKAGGSDMKQHVDTNSSTSSPFLDLSVVKEEHPEEMGGEAVNNKDVGDIPTQVNNDARIMDLNLSADHHHGTRSKKQQFNKYKTTSSVKKPETKDTENVLCVSSTDENTDDSEGEISKDSEDNSSSLSKVCKSDLKVKIVNVKSLKSVSSSVDPKKGNSKPINKYSCDKCQTKFVTKMSYNLHNYETHNIEIDGIMCSKCGRQFQFQHELEIHKMFTCCKLQRLHECGKCKLKFLSKNQKVKHACTKNPSKPFYCIYENCKFSTKLITTLCEHICRHLGIKQYLCGICGNSFATKKDMDRHTDTHKPTADCTCQHCGKTYKSAHSLRAHMRKHKNKNRYKCEHCPYTAHLHSSFTQHMIKHTLPKHKCKTCGKNLRSARSLENHIKSWHTLDKIFTCKYCDFSSKIGSSYSRHMRKHKHLKETFLPDEEQRGTDRPLGDQMLTPGLTSPTTYFSISNKQSSSTPLRTYKTQRYFMPMSTNSPAQPVLVGDPSLHFEGEVNISGHNADALLANIVSSADCHDISVITSDAAETSLNLYGTESVSHSPAGIPLPNLILSESISTEEG